MATFEAMNNTAPVQRLMTPSKVTAWLDCAHFLTLQHEVDDGVRDRPNGALGELARLLIAKGLEHEKACLAAYRADYDDVYLVPDRGEHEAFATHVERVGDVLARGHRIVYQMPFVHEGMRGIADFLMRVDLPDGRFTYEPVDAKLARAAAKPGHVLQLCFYADAIEATLGVVPEYVHLWLGSGRFESIRLAEVRAYGHRLRAQLKIALEPGVHAAPTTPVKCNQCEYCIFADVCDAQWRANDALQFVAGIRSTETAALETDGVDTLAGLAVVAKPVSHLQPERQQRLVTQASLQLKARAQPVASTPPFVLVDPPNDDEHSAGLAALPAPDDGDVFLDYEGHPFWRADAGLFFLFGLLTKGAEGMWVYEAWWAHTKDEEGAQTKALIENFAKRRAEHPAMHVYHYNHTERSALETMAAEHGADELLLQQMIDSGLFVDLLPVVRKAIIAGVESYGLKYVERLTGFERSHDIDKGAGAVVEYEAYTHDPEAGTDILVRIAVYNEDDVRATLALRDWLTGLRGNELEWRAAVIELPDKTNSDLDEQVAALLDFGPRTPEYLVGNLLGYWVREGRANTAQLLAKLDREPDELRSDPDTIVELEFVEIVPRFGKRGVLKWPGAAFTFPPQPIKAKLNREPGGRQTSVCFRASDGMVGWAEVHTLSVDEGRLVLKWDERSATLGVHPSIVTVNNWVPPRPKPEVLKEIAVQILRGSAPSALTMSILRADPPSFINGKGPSDGTFTDSIDDITSWVLNLDRCYVPIQGPPGTGKTWTGAHIVHALVKANRRVGITAMSHRAIDNFLDEVVEVFTDKGDLDTLRAARKGATDETPDIAQILKTDSNARCAEAKFNVVAGTGWLFASDDMCDSKVDVLIIDEAGQLGLADALAAMRSAHNVVLLGDPLQLPHVSQASHPERSGVSVLEHLLGEGVATVPTDRGVFLTTTRRMHPDVCRFISEQIYAGRLSWHESCARQNTSNGTGLRWLEANHQGCSTESLEEAALVVAEISQLLGTSWTDSAGDDHPLTAADFMVVAPYNDQVRVLRTAFEADHRLRGVRVGTVDKFQGQQAPIVFFTMTTSNPRDMPRDPGFLFSRNRLNVALSRARCLAYVVCTDELLNSRARDLEEMKLIATLCAAVDCATSTTD